MPGERFRTRVHALSRRAFLYRSGDFRNPGMLHTLLTLLALMNVLPRIAPCVTLVNAWPSDSDMTIDIGQPIVSKPACFFFVLVCMCVVACHPTPSQKYQRRLANTGAPALHAVHKDRLREIMADMNQLTFDRLPQEMDPTIERDRRIREISAIAGALAKDAELIPDILNDVRITQEDKIVFTAFASKLRNEALELKSIAERGDLQTIAVRLDMMVATCNACHTSFRILPKATTSN